MNARIGQTIGCGALALAGVLAGLWVALAGSSGDPPIGPAPPDASVLPPVPPAEENGWLLLRRGIEFGEAPTLDDDWPRADADAMAAALLAWTPPDEGVAVVREAFAMPRFAPDCPLDMAYDCYALPALRAHRLAVALALRDALAPPDRDAVELARVLTLSRDALAGPRSLVTAVMGTLFVRETLDRIEDLLLLAESGAAAPTAAEANALIASLDALDPGEISIERGMIIEWIEVDRMLRDTGAEDGLDLPWVRAALGAQYAALIARAHDPRLPAPAPPEISRWQRLTDPAGSALIETLAPTVAPHVDAAAQERDELAARLPGLRERARALRSRIGD